MHRIGLTSSLVEGDLSHDRIASDEEPNQRASPTANWPGAADAGAWPVGGGLRLTLCRKGV